MVFAQATGTPLLHGLEHGKTAEALRERRLHHHAGIRKCPRKDSFTHVAGNHDVVQPSATAATAGLMT